MATIDATKYLTPEQKAKIANAAFGPGTVQVPQVKIEAPLETKIQGETLAAPATLVSPEVSKEERVMNYTQKQADEARAAERNLFQQMIDERRRGLEKERTDAIRLATYNSLGNALRTMVQPVGWAVGGSTAGVQPYDDRQYIDAFNRAVRASNEIRNLGKEQMAYELNFANRDAQRAEKEYDYQKHRNESNADYFARLDEKYKVDKQLGEVALYEKRRDRAVDAYYTERARRISHKEPLITFAEFIDLGGLGSAYYGDWNPTTEEIQEVEAGAPQPKGNGQVVVAAETPVETPAEAPAQTTAAKQAKTSKGTKGNPTAPVATQQGTTNAPRSVNLTGRLGRRVANRTPQPAAAPAVSAPQTAEEKWGGQKKKKK